MKADNSWKSFCGRDSAVGREKSFDENADGTCVIRTSGETFRDLHFTGSHSAFEQHPDGKPYHTFRTASVLAEGSHLHFQSCSFDNTAGPGKDVGQAIALYLDGEDITLTDCMIRGHQDTLFLAPLPLREHCPDGFLGPRQFLPRTPRIYYFRRCLIEGGVDFIFGGATAFFEECEFRSVEPGYVFAPCTPEGVQEGFVARSCRFTAAENVPEGSCCIARPWRKYGKVRIENCFLDAHISRKGWDDWGRPEDHGLFRFVEEGSWGPGAFLQDRPHYVTVKVSGEGEKAGV